jgi:hypothetical protein
MHGGAEEHDAPMPPVLKTALVWGLFMGVSSNLRYQVCVGGWVGVWRGGVGLSASFGVARGGLLSAA